MEKYDFIASLNELVEALDKDGFLDKEEDNAFFVMGLSRDGKFSYQCVGRPQRIASGFVHCVENDADLLHLFAAVMNIIASQNKKEEDEQEASNGIIQLFNPSKIKS